MTSQAQASAPLPGVRGLAFLGFPLHPAGQPSQDRAKHLFDVQIPMLFLQGTRDTLATLDQLEPLCEALGRRATLKLFAGRRSFLPRAGTDRPHGCAGARRNAGRARRPGSTGSSKSQRQRDKAERADRPPATTRTA